MNNTKHAYLAVVNGKEKYVNIEGKAIPASENNFNVFAETDHEALSEARKQLAKLGLKERKFKGVIMLK
jgi:hypothetical protein